MRLVAIALVAALLAPPTAAQVVPPPAKSDGEPVQHGAQPNEAEVRPGSREGDAPSAAAGDLVTRPAQRIFGLPVSAALLIGGVLLALFLLAGLVIPRASRRERARGGGTYGRR
jgi:hypothetical protein